MSSVGIGTYASPARAQWKARICSTRLSSTIETTDEIPKRATFSGVSMVKASPITGMWNVCRSGAVMRVSGGRPR